MTVAQDNKARAPHDAERAGAIVSNEVEIPRSPKTSWKLPAGYLDPDTGTLYRDVWLREMTTEIEELLAARNTPYFRKVDGVLTACIEKLSGTNGDEVVEMDPRKIGRVVPDMSLSDRNYLFYCIRRASIGDTVPLRERCPHCSNIHVYEPSLATLPVYEAPEPSKRFFHVDMPSGKTATFKILTGTDDRRRESLKGKYKGRALTLALRITEIDGMPPKVTDIKAMKMRDRDFLFGEFVRTDSGIDTTMEITCKTCQEIFETEVDMTQPGFFSPSEVLAFWKKRYGL